MDQPTYAKAIEPLAVYPEAGTGSPIALNYLVTALAGEVGEILNEWKKVQRGNCVEITHDQLTRLVYELGDVYWYLTRLQHELEIELDFSSEPEAADWDPYRFNTVAMWLFYDAGRLCLTWAHWLEGDRCRPWSATDLSLVVPWACACAAALMVTPDQVRALNVAKLKDRHPQLMGTR